MRKRKTISEFNVSNVVMVVTANLNRAHSSQRGADRSGANKIISLAFARSQCAGEILLVFHFVDSSPSLVPFGPLPVHVALPLRNPFRRAPPGRPSRAH